MATLRLDQLQVLANEDMNLEQRKDPWNELYKLLEQGMPSIKHRKTWHFMQKHDFINELASRKPPFKIHEISKSDVAVVTETDGKMTLHYTADKKSNQAHGLMVELIDNEAGCGEEDLSISISQMFLSKIHGLRFEFKMNGQYSYKFY